MRAAAQVAGYSGMPLAQKLGSGAGATVVAFTGTARPVHIGRITTAIPG